MKVTIRQIAELAGVSVTTVSQILNNKGSRFSDETRRRVLQVVEENHYKPDFFASNLIKRHSKTIGMIVPDVTDAFFSKIVEGVERYIHPLGYMLILCNSHQSKENETRFLSELQHRAVDGILLATPHIVSEEYECKSKFTEQTPMILIDRGINQRDSGRLIVKEYEGSYTAVNYLIEQGHRHIGILKENTGYYQLEERFNGYRLALKDAGIPFRKQYVIADELTVQGGYRAAKELIHRKEITALFCGNDLMAMGCYKAITEMGKQVGKDISVIGFDDIQFAEYMSPPLTTVMQPTFDIGFTAAKFLVDAIEFPKHRIPNKIFDTKLIIRESVNALTF